MKLLLTLAFLFLASCTTYTKVYTHERDLDPDRFNDAKFYESRNH